MGGRSDQPDDTAGDRSRNDTSGDQTDDAARDRSSSGDPADSADTTVGDRIRRLDLLYLVGFVTVIALLARLVFLGMRTAHWDEARVAYWSYYYADTGSLAYYWEEHGPFLQITARWLFELFGVGDLAIRVPVAIIGGLLPMSAMLYREHLRKSETVALAILLATNSILVYFSRFMRSDVLVATFMFVAIGCLVRFFDTRRVRYLYGSAVFVALGFASKENAIVYLLTWLGATVLLADQFLYRPASDEGGLSRLHANVVALRERYQPRGSHILHAGGVSIAFLATIVFLFASRGDGVAGRYHPPEEANGMDLSGALSQPLELPGFALDTLAGTVSGFNDWLGQSEEKTLDSYISFLDGYLDVLLSNAPVLVGFAVIGFAVERYVRTDSRPLVMFMGYCGVASLVGYPLGSHIQGDWAWISVHIVVPLAIPAAVGLAWFYRIGLQARVERDTLLTVVIVITLASAAVWGGYATVNDVYLSPQSENNELVQYAQPGDDLGQVVQTLDDVAGGNGTDVLFYYGEQGDAYDENSAILPRDVENLTVFWNVRPICTRWSKSQPLNWYVAATDAEGTCERDVGNLRTTVESGEPPMIIGLAEDTTLPEDVLDQQYESSTYDMRLWDHEVVVYVHNSV